MDDIIDREHQAEASSTFKSSLVILDLEAGLS
jgi:hypothetical protein